MRAGRTVGHERPVGSQHSAVWTAASIIGSAHRFGQLFLLKAETRRWAVRLLVYCAYDSCKLRPLLAKMTQHRGQLFVKDRDHLKAQLRSS